MSKQRSIVCVVAACLLVSPATACAGRSANVVTSGEDPCASVKTGEPPKSLYCKERIHDREAVLYGGYERNGFLYFRIAYDHDVEPEHRRAVQGGMALWNAHTHETRVVFEETTSAIIDIRIQRGAPGIVEAVMPDGTLNIDEEKIKKVEQANCAEHVSDGSYIWYSPNILEQMKPSTDWLEGDVETLFEKDGSFKALSKIYAHELGHALNVRHKDTARSLMRKGDNGQRCRDVGTSIIADIQDDDVQDAHNCTCYARKNLRKPGAVRRP